MDIGDSICRRIVMSMRDIIVLIKNQDMAFTNGRVDGYIRASLKTI